VKLLALLVIFAAPVAASKGDVSAPAKMAASPLKGGAKPAPDTDKRVFHLQLKK
jgi:hypothetical protein